MPEFRTAVECINDREMSNKNDVDNDDSLYKLLGLAEIHVPQLTYNPLPLQCLAAAALPGNVKQEIEQLTVSSIKEVKRAASSAGSSSDQSNKRDSSSSIEEEIVSEMDARENIISVPLQFFRNGRTLQLIGGVTCSHSNKVHAQIVCIKTEKNDHQDTAMDQIATLNGQCVLLFNGVSLGGASFEKVRKMVKDTKDILVNLTIKDCSRYPNNVNDSIQVVAPKLTQEPTSQKINNDRPKLLILQKRQMFQRRFSVESLKSHAHFHTGSIQTRTNLIKTLSKSAISLKQSELARSISIVASPITAEEKPLTKPSKLRNKKISVNSLDSSMPASATKKTTMPTSILKGVSAMNTALLSQYNIGMPNGMIQLAFNYVKAHKTLYISLFKVKYSSIALGSENSGCFYNTYILPDKRSQSVKYAKIMSPNLATEHLYSRSASYILTEDELKSTSVRIILWEQNSQPFAAKRHIFKGEVFLDLNDTDSVSLHGVPQFCTICQPDPNLPPLPKPFQTNGGTLVRKMMDSTFGTLKKKKKISLPNPKIVKADSLMNISDTTKSNTIGSPLRVSEMLQPLKDPKEANDAITYCPVMLRPATVEMSADSSNGMSLYDFLLDIDPADNSNNNTTTKHVGLPMKSPLFSSCHEFSTTDENSESFNGGRRASCLSDGDDTVSYPFKHRRKGSLLSFLDSFNRPVSQISQTESHNSTSSEISSSLSSVSIDKSKDGNRFQGWSEASSNKSEHYDSVSDISVHSSENHRRSNLSIAVSNPGNSPMHNSIVFRQSFSDLSPSPTGSLKGVDQPNSATSSIHDGSYSCEQVPVISSDSDLSTPVCSNNTLTPSIIITPNNVTDGCIPDTVKAVCLDTTRLDFFPLRVAHVPLNSTPKKNQQQSDVRVSRSMGNITNELQFVDANDYDGASFGEFVERELSCLDITNMKANFTSSQDNSCSQNSSQREALESSGNSSSLDFNFTQPVTDRKRSPLASHSPLTHSPRMAKTFHVNSPKSRGHLVTHKWASMDNLQGNAKDRNVKQSPKLRLKLQKTASASLVKKLSIAYENGKPKGSVKLHVTAKFVASQIKVDILDVMFFDGKLMNGDFDVRVNLYNRLNESCEQTLKGYAIIRKNGQTEKKELSPSSFEFSANPMVFYLQVVFQISNRVFGKKQYHVWIDVKNTIMDASDDKEWYHLRKLST